MKENRPEKTSKTGNGGGGVGRESADKKRNVTHNRTYLLSRGERYLD